MTPAETGSVVAFMAEAWPWANLGEHTVEVWADACLNVEVRTGQAAIRRLVKVEERPPSVARFLTECRLVNREHAQPVRALGPMRHSDKAEAATKIAGIRKFWAEASAGRPEHNHHNGDDQCPRCSTTDQFISDNAQILSRWLRDYRAPEAS